VLFGFVTRTTPADLPLDNICQAFADNDDKANAIKAEQLALAMVCYHNNCYGNACCWQLFVITTERF